MLCGNRMTCDLEQFSHSMHSLSFQVHNDVHIYGKTVCLNFSICTPWLPEPAVNWTFPIFTLRLFCINNEVDNCWFVSVLYLPVYSLHYSITVQYLYRISCHLCYLYHTASPISPTKLRHDPKCLQILYCIMAWDMCKRVQYLTHYAEARCKWLTQHQVNALVEPFPCTTMDRVQFLPLWKLSSHCGWICRWLPKAKIRAII